MGNKNKFIKVSDQTNNNDEVMVSIIVDTFNHEKYISENLDSILSQVVNFNVEILVHDDCSHDNTVLIIKKYCEKYPNLIKPIFEKENQFSKGIEIDSTFNYPRIKGKYVAMLEGDDKWIDNKKLLKQVNYLEKHKNISAYIARTIRFNMRDNSYGYYGLAIGSFNKLYTLKDFIKGKDFSVSSFLARKEFFIPPFPDFVNFFAGFTDIQLGFYFALRNKVYYSHKPMSLYRQYSSPSSFTSSFSKLDINKKICIYENRVKVLKLLYGDCPNKYKKILSKRIRNESFLILILKNDIDSLLSPQYKKLYLRKKRHDKVKKILKIS